MIIIRKKLIILIVNCLIVLDYSEKHHHLAFVWLVAIVVQCYVVDLSPLLLVYYYAVDVLSLDLVFYCEDWFLLVFEHLQVFPQVYSLLDSMLGVSYYACRSVLLLLALILVALVRLVLVEMQLLELEQMLLLELM